MIDSAICTKPLAREVTLLWRLDRVLDTLGGVHGSELNLMISPCPGCHAKVGRTRVVLSEMPPLLLVLWREQHPEGHEQVMIGFTTKGKLALPVPLFSEER
jgi:hypothetical protein